MSLRNKTVSGISWSLVDYISKQGLTFIIGIILARLLSPREFGLIGMITIFIAISESFINSGFSQALIRKKDCTQIDYSTVFFFNFFVGIVFFVLLFFLAPLISSFYDEPQLKDLVRVLGLVLIIDSITLIQRTTLTKNINFKLQTKISIISNIISGTTGIILAYWGLGVWSLVIKTITQKFVNSLLLWLWNRWRPLLIFSKNSFKELFSFGSNLLISGLINTLYQNIYYLIIGKYFSAQELGFYTKSKQFSDLPSQGITGIISRVSYPVLSQLQDNKDVLKKAYVLLIKNTTLITFVLMIGVAAVAEPLILSLIGEKWRNSIAYLQILCFIGMLYPLQSLNLNILNVNGRSDLFLKLEIIKKFLAIPAIIIGVFWGIKIMILGMVINALIAYYLNSYWSGKLINYPLKEQIYDILPALILALFNGSFVFMLGKFLPFENLAKLAVQSISGAILVIILCEIFKISAYFDIKKIVLSKIYGIRDGRK